ncbi:MAG: AraC family transcriptional regulator [Prevotellaceae bacterium]|nr:AraC family transcriptional regulator [Prevotellaceae bacterium]
MNKIETVSLDRLREKHEIPSIGDDLLFFEDIQMIPQLDEPRRMNCIIIGICTEGEGGYTLNENRFSIKPGDALILTEGQIVNEIWMSDNTKGYAMLISRNYIDEVFKELRDMSSLFLLAREHPIFPLNSIEIAKLKQYLDIIRERLKTEDYRFRKEVVRLLLVTMIYDIGSAIMRVMNNSGHEGNTNSKAKRCFVQFIQLVEQHYKKERRVSWYANQMGLTPKYLSEIISSTSKRTPNDWIDKYVTTEIRNQLSNTNKKISEIAEDLHFPSQSFLGKYFREIVGLSPSEYRKIK